MYQKYLTGRAAFSRHDSFSPKTTYHHVRSVTHDLDSIIRPPPSQHPLYSLLSLFPAASRYEITNSLPTNYPLYSYTNCWFWFAASCIARGKIGGYMNSSTGDLSSCLALCMKFWFLTIEMEYWSEVRKRYWTLLFGRFLGLLLASWDSVELPPHTPPFLRYTWIRRCGVALIDGSFGLM